MANINLGLLKPLRMYSELNVLPFQSLHNETGAKGSLVSWFNASGINMDQAAVVPFANLTSQISNNNAYSPQYFVRNKVKLATSGEKVCGMLLYDQLKQDPWGHLYRYDSTRAWEHECTVSGDPTPICQRGYFLVNVGTGATVTATGSYLAISDTVAGGYKVQGSTTNAVGKFQGTKDSDGYALVFIDTNAVMN